MNYYPQIEMSKMDHTDSIRKALQAGRVLVVVGTGVSTAFAKDRTACSWPGLLNAGLEYVKSNGIVTSPAKLAAIQNDILIGSNEDGDYLLTAADKLVSAMGGKATTNFTQYIEQTIGSLTLGTDAQVKRLSKAIDMLGARLITTNYDTLLDEATGRGGVTWFDRGAFKKALSGESRNVAHLHGVWTSPESIILTSQDYGRILSDEFVEAMKASIGSLSTILFIGFGAGLTDPTFTTFRAWFEKAMPGATVHYQLCLQEDLPELAQGDVGSILPVSYGTTYGDLPEFLESLSFKQPLTAHSSLLSPSDQAKLAATCRRQLMDQLVDTSVIISNGRSTSGDELELSDLVIPPLLIPLPPEAFASEQERADSTVRRLDASAEVAKDQAILIIGDEHTGVSTALRWCVIKRSLQTGEIPVYLDFLGLSAGQNLVQNAVRKYLRAAGASLSNRDPLPSRLIVAVDNVGAGAVNVLKRLVRDALSVDAPLTIFGCHTGSELDVQSEFAATGNRCTPMYLGKVNLQYATALAERVNPANAKDVAEKALTIASRERLSRTPLSVTLLIVGISSADSWVTSVSNTSFIDAFVDSLLGRGDPLVDARLQIDAAGYSLVLQHLAELFVKRDTAAVDRIDLLLSLAESLARLDWTDRPDDVLRSLVSKGLLVDRDGAVRFRQSAYLHIFVAKRAAESAELLKTIMDRPLYYSAMIRHYAALKRNDAALLNWAYDLLGPADDLPTPAMGTFGARGYEEIAESADRLESLAQTLDIAGNSPADEDAAANDDEQARPPLSDEDELDEYDPYESMSDSDREPFPSPQIEQAPLQVRIVGLISLVSNIIRDSELVEDPDLKERVLARALRVWGQFIAIMGESPHITAMIDSLVTYIGNELQMEGDELKQFRQAMIVCWPLFLGMTGVQDELATIKLSKALARIGKPGTKSEPVHLVLMVAILQYQLNLAGWPAYLRELWREHGTTVIVRSTALVLAQTTYSRTNDPGLSQQLEDLIIDIECADIRAAGKSDRKMRGLLKDRLRKDKSIVRSRRIAAGRQKLGS